MGKGKDDTQVVVKLLDNDGDPSKATSGLNKLGHKHGIGGSDTVLNTLPPGVPECDIILKGSTRCWYLESALFLFGIAGVLISAIMLIWHYVNSSTYF